MLCTEMYRTAGVQEHQSRIRHMAYFQMSLQTSIATGRDQRSSTAALQHSMLAVSHCCDVKLMLAMAICAEWLLRACHDTAVTHRSSVTLVLHWAKHAGLTDVSFVTSKTCP